MAHNYGLENREEFAVSDQWKSIPYKKVVLANVKQCENRITVGKIARHLRNFGSPIYELAEAVWLTEAVVKAINANKPTAEISRMFYCQLGSCNGEFFSRKSMADELYKKLFKKIDENEDQITVKLNWWCLL